MDSLHSEESSHSVNDFPCHGGPDEICSTYLNGTRSDEQELQSIRRVRDAPNTNDRTMDGLDHLIGAAKGDGFDSRPGESSDNVGKFRTPRKDVHGHCRNGIDAGKHVASRVNDSPGDLRNPGDIGSELGDDGHGCCSSNGLYHSGSHRRVCSENHASLFDVWTADVDFDGCQSGNAVQS
jgi:hypothetical protein